MIRAIILIPLMFASSNVFSQKINFCREFEKLSKPEKCWTFRHVFIAKKTFKITQQVRKKSDSIMRSNILDSDPDGGTVDAFKHSLWMASISFRFNWRKAKRLGNAHEKGNYINYKHGRFEDGKFPDKISSDMDLYNNIKGIEIGKTLKNTIIRNTNSMNTLQQIIIDSIHSGKMMIIKKNQNGELLDRKGDIINKDSIKGKWHTPKTLVPSDFTRPK